MLVMLEDGAQHHVMTPNSEMLVEASHNAAFHQLLHATDLNLPDSAGLLWAAYRTGQIIPERVAGVDAVTDLCLQIPSEHSVFFLGGAEGIAEKAAAVLQRWNPQLKIAGTYAGSPTPEDAPAILERINGSSAHILLVAYGAPAQDLWIHQHLSAMPAVRLAMGIGGTLDFLAGKAKRAPAWMQRSHVEWLWRLMKEPRRLPRIWRAVVVFPLLVLRGQLRAR